MTCLVLIGLSLASLVRTAAWVLPGVAPDSGMRMQDFRDATYFPVREFWRSGGVPYDPERMFAHWPVIQEFDLYLPAHLWIHAPLAAPGYHEAAILMFALNVGILFAISALAGMLSRPFCTPGLVMWATFCVLMVGQVGKAQLTLGQINPLVALAGAGALVTRSPRVGALCLALAWLKPQFGLPLTVALFLVGHARRAWLGTLLAFLGSLPVVALLVFRTGGISGFVDVLRRNVEYATRTGYGAVDSPEAFRIDAVSVTARTLGHSVPGWLEPLWFAIALTMGVWLFRRARGIGTQVAPDPQGDCLPALVLAAWLLVAVVHQPGDVLLLAPLTAVVASAVRGANGWLGKPWLLIIALMLLSMPHALIFAVNTVVQDSLGQNAVHLLPGWSVVAGTLLLTTHILRRNPARIQQRNYV